MNKQQEPRLRFKGFTGKWKNKTLGDLGRVEMCRRIFKEQTQPSGEIPFFKIGTFGQEPDAFISSELFEEYRQKYPYPKQGDILISAAGTIGRTVEFTGENAYFQDSNIVWLRFDESQITSTFLNITYQNIKWDLEGSTIKRLYNSDLLSAEITIPSLPEQTHLGLFFRRLDSQIAESRAVLEKSRQLKKAMLAKMFPANGEKIPEIRFKGFEGEWECRKLGDVVEIVMGQSPSSTSYTDNPSDFILVQGNADMKNGKVCPRVWTTECIRLGAAGDIVMSVRAPVGDVGKTDYDIVVGRGVCAIKGNEFIYQTLCKMKLDGYWNSLSSGSTFEAINSNDVKNSEILIPIQEEQTAIGNFFRQLDETIALQSAEVEKLNQLKKGLLAAMLV